MVSSLINVINYIQLKADTYESKLYYPLFMVSYLFLHSCSLDNMGFDIESDSEEVIVDTKSTDFSYLDRPMVLGDKLENPYTINNMRNAYQALEEQGSKPSFPISEIYLHRRNKCYIYSFFY